MGRDGGQWLDTSDPNYGSWSSWPWCHHCYSMCRSYKTGPLRSLLIAFRCWRLNR